MGLTFVGLGLHDEEGITIRGLEEARKACAVYAEFYTSPMPRLSLDGLEAMLGRAVRVVDRAFLEGEGAEEILSKASAADVVLLVPGDPLIATTHAALRVEAERRGIRTRVVHGVSILSAAISLSGLHNYKFGRSVTIPFTESETPYDVLRDNRATGLHTLVFLDVEVERDRYMTVREGLRRLLALEGLRGEGVVTPDTLVIGLARVGSDDSVVRAGPAGQLLAYDFGDPPHLIIVPARLHFTEAEALIRLHGAPKEVVDRYV